MSLTLTLSLFPCLSQFVPLSQFVLPHLSLCLFICIPKTLSWILCLCLSLHVSLFVSSSVFFSTFLYVSTTLFLSFLSLGLSVSLRLFTSLYLSLTFFHCPCLFGVLCVSLCVTLPLSVTFSESQPVSRCLSTLCLCSSLFTSQSLSLTPDHLFRPLPPVSVSGPFPPSLSDPTFVFHPSTVLPGPFVVPPFPSVLPSLLVVFPLLTPSLSSPSFSPPVTGQWFVEGTRSV